MDGIKALSEAVFNAEQKFSPPQHSAALAIHTIDFVRPPGEPKREEPVIRCLDEERLCSWFASPTEPGAATLRLARIPRQIDISLEISQASFLSLLSTMRSDKCVRYLICRDYDGFHTYGGGGGAAVASSAAGTLTTRFLGTALYGLVWTFDPSTLTTLALFLDRRRQTFPDFVDTLRALQQHLAAGPSLLGFASSLFLMHEFDAETERWELKTLRKVEAETGLGPHPGFRANEVRDFDIRQLTSWLQAVGEVGGDMDNRMRHVRAARAVLEVVKSECTDLQELGFHGDDARERYRDAAAALAEATPVMDQRMATYLEYLAYMSVRAQRLSAVLFAQLTHVNASASIGLARSSAQDSSSMKTIAVMTMAFLPATFFAALFAMPSLQWNNQDKVVQDGFWVYWALTLPTTAMVFLVWLLMHRRERLAKQLSRSKLGK
ncbi:hypothetical protein MAPG_11521 [Magnaporthiopsis poae ATCC 64411]|uniref:Uncharacterized protein n=1 Tax=Magnaporthiopsis poae (strain ATCC 64411 / 73-15) TaxID=644358 RepID=A0A0C4EFH3_MAGP6|nr:hypothetical protein MAPG_11521 [Magnaporthiopsis poae ATCC 64411]